MPAYILKDAFAGFQDWSVVDKAATNIREQVSVKTQLTHFGWILRNGIAGSYRMILGVY